MALIERAWKRHLYTKQLRDYGRMRRVLRKRMLTKAFGQWRDYTRAQRFASTGLMKTVFSAWREYCSDLEEFFKKVGLAFSTAACTWERVLLNLSLLPGIYC